MTASAVAPGAAPVFGLGDLPVPLRVYLLAVVVAGPAAAFAVGWAALAGHNGGRLGRAELGLAALSVILGAVAERFSIHMTHKTRVSVSNAAYLAMIYIFPVPIAGILALFASAIGEGSRFRKDHDAIEALFNVGQTALGVTLTAASFAALRDVAWLGPPIDSLGGLGAMLVAAATLYAVNTGLVSVAAALHLGSNPLRIWQVTLFEDLAAQAILVPLGIVAAYLAREQPLMLPALALPLVLVHRAIGENVQLRKDTHGALAALVEVVELRDPYTAGHSQRVATLGRDLALRLGLTNEEADLIESAGLVHDLGKVAVDPAILAKPGRLDEREWAEMRRHPAMSADVVARFTAYGEEAHRVVRHHHEAWDGSGYPDGLAGEDIPLGARILAVADTFDALTSARPYRSARPTEEALAILEAGTGRQWDPRVVGALLAHFGHAPALRPATPEATPSSAPASPS